MPLYMPWIMPGCTCRNAIHGIYHGACCGNIYGLYQCIIMVDAMVYTRVYNRAHHIVCNNAHIQEGVYTEVLYLMVNFLTV